MTAETAATATHRGGLTVREKILVAAVALGAGPFDVDALVLRAWQLYPESFSLTGGAHPDSNRVLAKLSGTDGLCARGWLARVAHCTYELTKAGALAERRLRVEPPPPAPRRPRAARSPAIEEPPIFEVVPVVEEVPADGGAPAVAAPAEVAPAEVAPAALAMEDAVAVTVLARCEALRKFLRGSPLAFADALAFWGASPKRPRDVGARIEAVGALLDRVVAALAEGVPAAPKLPSLSTCYGLHNLHRLMVSRFARELEAVRAQEAGRG